jgi:transcriptional regulator with XRE-family HTH domain
MEPGQLLREARRRSRLSQYEVAIRAGCSQSEVARVESDQRVPSLTLFDRMLAACDYQLSAELVPLDTSLDQQIEKLAIEEVSTSLRQVSSDLAHLAQRLTVAEVPFVVEGVAAAILYGSPLPFEPAQLRIQDKPDVLRRFARALELRRDLDPATSPFCKDLQAFPRLRYIYDLRDPDLHWLAGYTPLRVRTQLADPCAGAVTMTVRDYDREATVSVVPLQRLVLPRKYARALERMQHRLTSAEAAPPRSWPADR